MRLSRKEESYLEGSLMPQAKFLQVSYSLAIFRYRWARNFTKNKVVVDIGCGSGYGTNLLAYAGAKKIYGIDNNLESIKYCQKHYHHKNLIFKKDNAANLNLPDRYFDLIVAFEVIEHLKNYPKAISEFYRILKPGGLLILSTPNKALYSPGAKKVFYPFHEHEFCLPDLRKILKNFQIQQIYGQYIKGKKSLLYPSCHPKRILRIIYANLPFSIKIFLMRWYLKIFLWIYKRGIYHPKKIKSSDVYFSKNLDQTRVFVAICQKAKNNAKNV